jgi:hypothetical protein
VGASLLAKAVYHSTSLLADTPFSRAGSLPQWIFIVGEIVAGIKKTACEGRFLFTAKA